MKQLSRRWVLVAVCVGILGVVAPVQPASAGPAQCGGSGSTVYIENEKTHTIWGYTGTSCSRIVPTIGVWSYVEKWSPSAREWVRVGSRSDSNANVSFWMAEPIMPCPTNGHYRMTGDGRAISDVQGGTGAGVVDTSYQSGGNYLACFRELPDIAG